jgi:alkylation response protein AidB-like acyl-CoA dehydrogenase
MAVINLQFDVLVPKQSHQEAFEQDRKAGGVKEKAFRDALRDLDAGAFAIVIPGAGPGMPDTPLDETKTLEELGLADGARLVIKPQ